MSDAKKSADSYFQTVQAIGTTPDPEAIYAAGWDGRNDQLNKVMFGDLPATDLVEAAMKAYSTGYEEGAGDNDQVLTRLEDFARRVHGELQDGNPLKAEAAAILAALEASKEEPATIETHNHN